MLNQLLYDFHALKTMSVEDKEAPTKLFSSISKMCWLDGGHNGGKLTWPTDKSILKSFADESSINVDVRVTPYQVKDVMRPWIGKEEKVFSSTFRQLAASRLARSIHFVEDEPSLVNHFRVIDTLCDDIL